MSVYHPADRHRSRRRQKVPIITLLHRPFHTVRTPGGRGGNRPNLQIKRSLHLARGTNNTKSQFHTRGPSKPGKRLVAMATPHHRPFFGQLAQVFWPVPSSAPNCCLGGAGLCPLPPVWLVGMWVGRAEVSALWLPLAWVAHTHTQTRKCLSWSELPAF